MVRRKLEPTPFCPMKPHIHPSTTLLRTRVRCKYKYPRGRQQLNSSHMKHFIFPPHINKIRTLAFSRLISADLCLKQVKNNACEQKMLLRDFRENEIFCKNLQKSYSGVELRISHPCPEPLPLDPPDQPRSPDQASPPCRAAGPPPNGAGNP